jgi:branched-chain amino acid transport system ATP-binding protein
MQRLLEVDAIGKRFRGLQALDNVSFAVDEGGVFGVIGANGAGKTTLFNIISGAMKPDAGTVRFAGNDVTSCTPSSLCMAGIGRTFQIARPFPELTVLETIRVAVLCHLRNMRAATERAAEIAARFGLAQKIDRLGRHLSVLERKRLELARAYATGPRLLLLDEVAAGLRPTEVDDLVALIRAIAEENITVLMIEHVLAAVFALARRVVVLDQGRVIAEGPPRQVAKDVRVVEAYLGAGYAAP